MIGQVDPFVTLFVTISRRFFSILLSRSGYRLYSCVSLCALLFLTGVVPTQQGGANEPNESINGVS